MTLTEKLSEVEGKQTDLDGHFQWAVPSTLGIPEDPLKLRLDFHSQAVVMHVFLETETKVKTVSALDIAHALSRELTVSTGLLSPDTLFWCNTRDGEVEGIWVEPGVRTLALQERAGGQPTRYTIPTPGLIFLCKSGTPPWVFAVKRRPTKPTDPVYKAPFYNVFANGRVCPGTHKFPVERGNIPDSFFRSFFSPTGDYDDRSKKHPSTLKNLWKELGGRKTYPLKDLVAHGTVQDLMQADLKSWG